MWPCIEFPVERALKHICSPGLRFASVRAPEEVRLEAGVGLGNGAPKGAGAGAGRFSSEKKLQFFLRKMISLFKNMVVEVAKT